MAFIRLSEAQEDEQILVNTERIVRVRPVEGPLGADHGDFRLLLELSDDRHVLCFPLDSNGGLRGRVEDESELIHDFQRALVRAVVHSELEQGTPGK